ncbi:MAG TPA: DUF6335 family protein [Vicinamibacterales bacterium]|jgi:hypothetical protein|nr:DUF6335 family protein [Vicinamibacterales bacterium]
MAKRKPRRPKTARSSARKRVAARPTAKRSAAKSRRTPRRAKRSPKKAAPARKAATKRAAAPGRPIPKAARLERARRTLEETVQTPPSSLDLDRRGTAVRTGRAEMAESRMEHRGMGSAITGGDVDTDLEDAYFTGDGAPGGDNPSPDQDIVDDIGRALGVEYQDNEELKAADKVTARDRKRWELDPASSEDYRDRK